MKIYFNKIFLKFWTPFAIIAVLGFLLYAQILFFDFTYLDDNTLILDDQSFLSNPANFSQAFKTDVFHVFNHSASYYRPLLTISLMLDYQLGGITPFVYHLNNIILHILSVCLLFVFLKKMKYKKNVSFLFSLIFLTHPVLTQAVAWIPGRNDSLLAVFIFASFIFFLNFLQSKNYKYYFLHLIFFGFALFTKETAIASLIIFLLYFYLIYNNKEKFQSITNSILNTLKFFNRSFLTFGWIVIGIFWLALRQNALKDSLEMNFLDMIGFALLNLPAVIQLIGKIIFPFNLSVLPIMQDTTFIYGIIAIILLFVSLIFSKHKRYNYIIFGTFWFLLFLLPSFIRPNLEITADFIEHRIYLPLIGFFIVLLEVDFIKKLNFQKKKVLIISTLIFFIFTAITFIHSGNFKNRINFWQNAVKNSPHSPLAHRNLGAMYYLEEMPEKAEIEYKEALKLNSLEEMAHNNLGLIYMNKGNFKKAEIEFKQELLINPYYDNAFYNFGLLYYKQNKIKEAEYLWQKALQINPNSSDAYNGLRLLYGLKQNEAK